MRAATEMHGVSVIAFDDNHHIRDSKRSFVWAEPPQPVRTIGLLTSYITADATVCLPNSLVRKLAHSIMRLCGASCRGPRAKHRY